MKGVNSRFSHRPDRRYDRVLQQQGAMVTDADLVEAEEIARHWAAEQGGAAMASGTPAQGGAVVFSGGLPALQPGLVLAEGRIARLAARPGTAVVGPLGLYAAQADLPFAPALPAGAAMLYADLWTRPVFATEDSELTDAGLHGAETAYRGRTMVQVKAIAGLTAAQAAAAIAAGTYPFLRRGNAVAAVAPQAVTVALDPCDPCADQIEAEATVPNALFRLEAVAVDRDASGAPTAVRLAWSLENAAAVARTADLADTAARDAFARDKSVYEFFSDATEAHAGILPGGPAQRPALTTSLSPAPSPGTDNGGQAYPYVRRWDGAALLTLATGAVTEAMGTGVLTAAAGTASLVLDGFTLTLAVAGKQVQAGDHWLVELRRHAAEPLRVRLAPAGADGLPLGIVHAFCLLFPIAGGAPVAPDDAGRRRLSFPPLTDLPATHVAYAPACPALFDNATTVAGALDALCNLNATEVAYTPACPPLFDNATTVAGALDALCDLDATEVKFTPPANCARLGGSTTVAEALGKLCAPVEDDRVTRLLRTMMDWGVVCGLRLSLVKAGGTEVAWTAGTVLDRAGNLYDVPAGRADIATLDNRRFVGGIEETMLTRGEICLAFALVNGKPELFVAPAETAFGPEDRDFEDRVAACIAGLKTVKFADNYATLDVAAATTVAKVVSVWQNSASLSGNIALTQQEAQVASAFNDTLITEYRALVSTEQADAIDRLVAQAEADIAVNAVSGAARDKRRMQLESAKYGIVASLDDERRVECRCRNLLTPCPPAPGDAPFLVPVACIAGVTGGLAGIRTVARLCDLCCRKQAMTWRAERYLRGTVIDRLIEQTEGQCCPDEPKPEPGGTLPWLDKFRDRLYPESRFKPPKIVDERPPKIPKPGDPGPLLFDTRPDIRLLSPLDATDILTGTGFSVVGNVDVEDTGAWQKLTGLGAEAAAGKVLNAAMPEPGDKVAVLVREGKAVDFVLVEKGNGRLPFVTASEQRTVAEQVESALAAIDFSKLLSGTGTRPGGMAPDLGALDAGLADMQRRRAEAETGVQVLAKQLDQLEAERTRVLAETRGASAELEALGQARERLGAELGALRGEVDRLATLRAETDAGLAASRAALEELRAEQGRMIETVRRNQPIEAVVGDAAVATALRRSGIASVGDLEAAPAATLQRLERERQLAPNSGAALQGDAARFVRR